MSRRKAREMALQALFQLDFNQLDKDGALNVVFEEYGEVSESARNYAMTLVKGTLDHLDEINKIVSSLVEEWTIDRMAGVDRSIVRMAIYEMRFGKEDLPPNVVINEAVELAKIFGTEDSSRFVNGILGSLVRKTAKA